MHSEYTAVVKQDGDWWIGWIEEIPGVNCQEHSREELLISLKETLTTFWQRRFARISASRQ